MRTVLASIAFGFVGQLIYLLLRFFSTQFKDEKGEFSRAGLTGNQVQWYVAFRVFFICVKPMTLYLGSALDKQGANPAVQLVHCYSFLLQSLYFVMYRDLLLPTTSIEALLQATALHALWEFFSFAVRITYSWYSCYHSLMRRWPCRICYGGAEKEFYEAYHQVIRRQSVEYGNRLILTVFTLFFFAGRRSLLLRFHEKARGPMASWYASYRWYDYRDYMLKIAVMLCSELLVYALVMLCNRRREQRRALEGSFLAPWLEFIRENRHLLILVVCLAHNFTDPDQRLHAESYVRRRQHDF